MNNNYNIIRQSLIEWYPITEGSSILLINGSDNDKALEELLEKKGSLSVVDSYDDLSHADNGFDYVIFYDLYSLCINSEVAVKEMIKEVMSHKSKTGTLLIAMENKIGMKYWAGCEEEQRGGFFAGIEDYDKWNENITPLSKRELEDVLKDLDIEQYNFYYPYPDYKYPTIIYSDKNLPSVGELSRNIRNVDKDRFVMFDERRAFDSIIKAGLFVDFSNSFLLEVKSLPLEGKGDREAVDEVSPIYTKYSTDRTTKFMIRTDKIRNTDGTTTINKVALFDEGVGHLNHMVDMCHKMQQRYGDKIYISKSEVAGNTLTNEFVAGKSLSNTMERLLDARDKDALIEAIDDYNDKISYSAGEVKEFEFTPKFKEVFGEADELNFYDKLESYKLECADVTNVDMIFDNIIVSDEGTWQLIDYEWTFDFPIPKRYVLYRTLWYWYNSTEVDNVIEWHEVMSHYKIDYELEMIFRHMEVHLQKYIAGDNRSIEQIIAESGIKTEAHDYLVDKALFYEEGMWYKKNYNVLQVEQADTKKQLSSALYYKKAADKVQAEYNNLQDLYVLREANEADKTAKTHLKAAAKKILKK